MRVGSRLPPGIRDMASARRAFSSEPVHICCPCLRRKIYFRYLFFFFALQLIATLPGRLFLFRVFSAIFRAWSARFRAITSYFAISPCIFCGL